jgi:hypothetical protein
MKTLLPKQIALSFLLILLFIFSKSIKAQEQCLDIDKYKQVSNTFSQNKLVSGDFNGDNKQDIAYYSYDFSGPIRIINGTAGNLMINDSISVSSYYAVSAPGDINGDGFDDLLISSGTEILIYNGSASGLPITPTNEIDLKELLNSTDSNIKGYVEKYRDINSDGAMDILVGAGIPNVNLGRLFLIQGGIDDLTIVTSFSGSDLGATFGLPIKNLGDLNGDGFIDIAANLGYQNNLTLFYGENDFFSSTRRNQIFVEDIFYYTSVNNVGDVNNDGFNDVVLSLPQNRKDPGAAFLFLGSASVVNEQPSLYIEDTLTDYFIADEFGRTSGPAGDVNGDGIDDFFVGGGRQNYTRIYFGKTDVSQIVSNVNIGISPYDMISAGDINGDGNNDWAASSSDPWLLKSMIYTVKGSSSGMTGVAACKASDLPLALSFWANSGKGAGDVNKDGYDDIVVGLTEVDRTFFDEIGQIEVVTGAPVGKGNDGMLFQPFNDYFGEQYGSGDFNGDGYSDVIGGRYGTRSVYVFYGSAEGIDNTIDVNLTEERMEGWGESLEAIGDLNNDGFDDFLSYGMNGMTLVLGASSGPYVFNGWNYGSFTAYKAGDGNNDGFADFFLKVPGGYGLFRGSANGPIMDPYISEFEVKFAGDVNSDGYDDMLTYNPINNSVGLLLGNASGYTNAGISILHSFKPTGIGDFNGDGFDDIAVASNLDSTEFFGGPSRVDIYLGTASGIQTSIFRTIRAQLKHNPLLPQPRVGDFNKDGREDLLVSGGFESWLVYGIGGVSNIVCPTETSIYADSSCMAEVNGVDPPGNPSLYKYSVTGYSIFEGMGSLNGKNLKAGTYFVTYSLLSDPQQQCTFTLRIRDTIAPKLVVPNPVVICNNNTMEANVPLLKIENNCQIASINYQLTGATTRTGTGLNASGSFNKGTTTVTWTVTDSSGNISTGTMNVTILEIFSVKIPKAYQINAQQSQENMIYLGYANNTLRLTAYEANSANHTYRWTTGDTTRYTRVRHDVPGRFKYSVFVTNEYGCRARADVFVKVVNIYCSNTGNISMCYNGSTVCVSPADVPAMVANGARLGKCGVRYQSNDMITAKEETNSVGALTLTASPNPSGYEFTLKIDGTKGKPYALRIINSVGSPVFMKQGITENIVRTGSSFQKGIYFAEVICGEERKVIKLLKVR